MNMTKIVKELMRESILQAKDYEDNKFRPEHILMSIILNEHNMVINILRDLDIDVDALFDDLHSTLTNSIINNNRLYNINNEILPSYETKQLIKEIEIERSSCLDKLVNECHIMLALLKTPSNVQKLLIKLKLNYKIFKDRYMSNTNNSNIPEGFESELNPKKKRPNKIDSTTSKTPALDGFCRDISKVASDGGIDPVVGRENEIKRITAILSRRKKNNPVLIGDPGVGKTSIVEGLALLINSGDAPKPLLDKKIYALDLSSIVAGTKYRGQFEERMKVILTELKDNPDIILFIDELHTLVGAGNASGSLDASNIFKPALARGEIQIIGATTLDEFRENIETDGALTRRFQQVLVKEPSLVETVVILKNIKENYEKYHNVKYNDVVIEMIVKLADRYISDRAMPDKAIDVLDEVGALTNIDVKLPNDIKALKDEIKALKNRMIQIINKQNFEHAAKLRDERRGAELKLNKLMNSWTEKNNKNSTDITPNMVEMVISTMTGIPLTKLTNTELNSLKTLEVDLTKEIIGQDSAIKKISKAIRRSRLGIRSAKKPIGSFIFLGPTGVGKCFLSDTNIKIRNKTTKLEEVININDLKQRIKH